jgi:hypothetical protein
LVRLTEPVGAGFPLGPLTVIATVSGCKTVIVEADGVTVYVGVSFEMNSVRKYATFRTQAL